jgi:hypothetical protein
LDGAALDFLFEREHLGGRTRRGGVDFRGAVGLTLAAGGPACCPETPQPECRTRKENDEEPARVRQSIKQHASRSLTALEPVFEISVAALSSLLSVGPVLTPSQPSKSNWAPTLNNRAASTLLGVPQALLVGEYVLFRLRTVLAFNRL